MAWFQRHGVPRRGLAVLCALLVVLAAIVGIGLLILPPLVTPDRRPRRRRCRGYVDDLTNGRGPLGFLQRDYHVVDRVRERIEAGGSAGSWSASPAGPLQVAATVVSTIVAIVTILVMVIFLLLGGPRWVDGSFKASLPVEQRDRARARGRRPLPLGRRLRARQPRRSRSSPASRPALVLLALGVPYALALALIVALFDLVPLVGATIGAAIVFLGRALRLRPPPGIIWVVFAIVYQQLENHLLQPVVYGRAVQLPAFAVLLAVLVGAKLAGVVGALGAIPAASAIQIIGADMLRQRRCAPARGPTRCSPVYATAAPSAVRSCELQVRVALELAVERGGADRERPHAEVVELADARHGVDRARARSAAATSPRRRRARAPARRRRSGRPAG